MFGVTIGRLFFVQIGWFDQYGAGGIRIGWCKRDYRDANGRLWSEAFWLPLRSA